MGFPPLISNPPRPQSFGLDHDDKSTRIIVTTLEIRYVIPA